MAQTIDQQRIAAARERKATAIAVVLRTHGVDADTAALVDDEGRRAAAGLAGVHKPSPDAWALVVKALRAPTALDEVRAAATRHHAARGGTRVIR